MKKNLVITLSIIMVFTFILTACANGSTDISTTPKPTNSPATTETPKEYAKDRVAMTANIVGLKGPTSMGMVKVFNELESLSDIVDLEYDIVTSPDLITAGLLNGEITVAAVPTNLAAVLYNKTEGNIRMLAINTLGVLHIVADKSENITSFADLKGKTLTTSGKGTVPEYVLNYLLEANGMTPGEDINIEYRSEHSEVATLAITGDAKIVLLPQPFVTIVAGKNENMELAVDLTDEWKKVAPKGSELAMGCIISTAEFAETYPAEVEKLLEAYEESINWVNLNPEEAAELIVEFGILPDTDTAVRAIPASNIRYFYSQDSKEILNGFYSVLKEFEPKSIGGSIPTEDFYFLP
ncbi:MAG: ABC transporter substrate-binding protein [Clostridiales bacterium]|nr:ABC transporter substrate-binding protein [Clostridiales bacterium]